MKKGWIITCLCCALVACNNVEQKANEKLQAAQKAYDNGQYNEAKALIDSIKILYPKAFDTRHKGNKLLELVELKEQDRTLNYLDSTFQQKQLELNDLKKAFVLEKDTAYQQVGLYLMPVQVIERNLHRSFLRFQTDEMGQMSMTSIYCGGRNIHHIAVKVTAPDGSFAETPSSKDSYETDNLGEKIEKADYKLGADGNVIEFICLNKDKNLKVTYLGERSYTTVMSGADKQAAVQVYQLAQILSAMTEIEKDKKEANLKKDFIIRKQQHDQQQEE